MPRLFLAAPLALALTACGGSKPAEGFRASLPPAPQPGFITESRDGAIFQVAQGYAGLHEGNRARRVGDVVTILLVENVTSTKRAQAATNRSGSASITPPVAGPLSILNPEALNASSSGSFNGTGNAQQSSSFNAALAVTIAEVRPNGTALVVGEKQMSLSQGREWIQFAGIVRLADVDENNAVLSSQVADARINYAGDGAIQQASRPGWLSRFFAVLIPF